jgi:hypothetical protein
VPEFTSCLNLSAVEMKLLRTASRYIVAQLCTRLLYLNSTFALHVIGSFFIWLSSGVNFVAFTIFNFLKRILRYSQECVQSVMTKGEK